MKTPYGTANPWAFFTVLLLAALPVLTGCLEYDTTTRVDPPGQELEEELPEEAPETRARPPAGGSVFQWIPGNPTILRLRADLSPLGYGIATAQGHHHVDPHNLSHTAPGAHESWMAANNARPPHRITNGYAEWSLPAASTLNSRATGFQTSSGSIVLVLFKLSGGTEYGTTISFFVDINQTYGTPGSRPPVHNRDNSNWPEAQ